MVRKLIGVMPARERSARRRLFDALEQTFPVRFEGRQPNEHAGLDAAVVLPAANTLVDALPLSLPRLVALAEEGATPPPSPIGAPHNPTGAVVALARGEPLDPRLRRLRLHDAALDCVHSLPANGSHEVLAASGGQPVWVTSDRHADAVALAPAELAGDECLRDRVRDGRFLAGAALVRFLRSLCADMSWRPPPLRASILFDDPNLHWPSYGYLNYRELVRQADRHGYHVALAMVPFDGWFVHAPTARLFRDRPDRLSLIVHGNNHARLELARAGDASRWRSLLSQALRRVAAFERRSGVPVARIMAAPHGVCSEEVARELTDLGFEGLCISRPFPWLARPGRPWLAKPEGSSALVGWHPASVVTGGLPVLLRQPFGAPFEEIALRAFLDQPLILYGHHQDLEGGVEQLADLAGAIRRLGDVAWMSPGEIARSNVTTWRESGQLRARMFSRRAEVELPPDVERITAEFPVLDAPSIADALENEKNADDPRRVEVSRTAQHSRPGRDRAASAPAVGDCAPADERRAGPTRPDLPARCDRPRRTRLMASGGRQRTPQAAPLVAAYEAHVLLIIDAGYRPSRPRP